MGHGVIPMTNPAAGRSQVNPIFDHYRLSTKISDGYSRTLWKLNPSRERDYSSKPADSLMLPARETSPIRTYGQTIDDDTWRCTVQPLRLEMMLLIGCFPSRLLADDGRT